MNHRSVANLDRCPGGRIGLAEHKTQNEIGEPAERGTQQCAAVPSPDLEHGFLVTERTEALDAVIRAKAARPNAPEREIVLRVMQERAVDGHPAGGRPREYLPPIWCGGSE